MSRRNIGDLPFPRKRYRIDRIERLPGQPGFETVQEARAEDRLRGNKCLNGRLLKGDEREQARRLGKRLLPGRPGLRLSTILPSARAMRTLRICLVGAVWALIDEDKPAPVAFFTVVSAKWRVPADELHSFNPRKMMRAFRSDLNRSGAVEANGWLVACLHGSYDPATNTFQLHVHGLASHGMIEAVDGLRGRRKFKRVPGVVHQPVRIERPLHSLPDPISYVMKSYWPTRTGGSGGDNGSDQTHRPRPSRIPEPHHSRVLLWLDQWELQDITLLMGLRVTKHGLKVTG